LNAVVRLDVWDSNLLEDGTTSIFRLGSPLDEYLPTLAEPDTNGKDRIELKIDGELISTVTELNHFDLFNMVAPVDANDEMYDGLTGKS
jgi:hypothetical protein